MTEAEASQLKSERRQQESFERFLARPEAKLMLSMIPPSENQDAMRTLLLMAFQAGVSCGSADILTDLMGHMLKDRPKPDRP